MQIRELTEADWVTLSALIAHLWVLAAFLVFTAFSYIVAHGLIPSLTYSGEIRQATSRLMRAPLYAAALLGVAAIVVVVVRAIIIALDILPSLYPRLAI